MANRDEVNGFRPWGRALRETPYVAGGTFYKGDFVKFNGSGQVEICAAGAAGMVGCAMENAVSGQTVVVADHPDQEFIGQADDGTISAQTNCNLNYNIIVGTASTLYKRSGMEIDASTGATDSNLPLKVLRLAPSVDNAFGVNAKLVCKINNHQLGSGADVGTLGV